MLSSNLPTPLQGVNDTLLSLTFQLNAALETAHADGDLSSVSEETLQGVMTPLVKFYTAVTENVGVELVPTGSTVTATEAVTLSCALLRAQDLNPFDLAIWFSRGRKIRPVAASPVHNLQSLRSQLGAQ